MIAAGSPGFGRAKAVAARALLASILMAAPSIDQSIAQTTPVIAWVANENANSERLAIFKKGLADLGYGEGRNITIEYRAAKLDGEYGPIMNELVALKVDIIVATNAPAAVAARKATQSIPIVLAAVNDPVGLGLVNSLERPGTNVTGTTMYAPQLIGERLRMLQKIIPALRKVAMVTNGNNANNPAQFASLTAAAQTLGIEVQELNIRLPADVEPAFRKAEEYGANGMLNAVDSFINSQRFTMATLAAQRRLPMIYTDREYVLAGGLMAIGPGHQEGFYGAAKYVELILHGANPAELPVAPTKSVDFSVSRQALGRSGLKLPKDVGDRVNDWLD
jgi:putative tryptophan/tyrosine transport system substrate-binding protein